MKKVLIIEDDLPVADALAQLLTESGYKVSVAVNGQQGLEELKKELPDAILLDLMMPVMDGWEFLKAVRDNPELRGLKVIVMSGVGEQEHKLAVDSATVVVQKPVEPVELERLIKGEAVAP